MREKVLCALRGGLLRDGRVLKCGHMCCWSCAKKVQANAVCEAFAAGVPMKEARRSDASIICCHCGKRTLFSAIEPASEEQLEELDNAMKSLARRKCAVEGCNDVVELTCENFGLLCAKHTEQAANGSLEDVLGELPADRTSGLFGNERLMEMKSCPEHNLVCLFHCEKCERLVCTNCIEYGQCVKHKTKRLFADEAIVKEGLDLVENVREILVNAEDHSAVEFTKRKIDEVKQEFALIRKRVEDEEAEIVAKLNDMLKESEDFYELKREAVGILRDMLKTMESTLNDAPLKQNGQAVAEELVVELKGLIPRLQHEVTALNNIRVQIVVTSNYDFSKPLFSAQKKVEFDENMNEYFVEMKKIEKKLSEADMENDFTMMKAIRGDTAAQLAIGDRFANGKGAERDYQQALLWYSKAAEKLDPNAQYMIGMCYREGKGVEADQDKALEWLEKAAKQGHHDAIATFSENALLEMFPASGLTKEEERFLDLLARARNDDPTAQMALATCFDEGVGVAMNTRKAFKWYKRAAKHGNAEAEYKVASAYGLGQGTHYNKDKSFKWALRSANQGNANGQFVLGKCYFFGEGTSEDLEMAVSWFTKAAESGHIQAQSTLAVCYEGGKGCLPSYEKALNWYEKSGSAGSVQSQYNVGYYYANGKGVPANQELAFQWFLKAAENGHAQAQFSVGVRYEEGKGVPEDAKQAFMWYHKAAEQGHGDAIFNLATYYEDGRGVDQDIEKAIEWYTKAARHGDKDAQEALNSLTRR